MICTCDETFADGTVRHTCPPARGLVDRPEDHPCRQCGSPSMLQVGLAAGCVVFPEDRTQWLCAQHWDRLTPLGDEPPEILSDWEVGV